MEGAAGDDDICADASLRVPKLIAADSVDEHELCSDLQPSRTDARAMPVGCFGIVTPSPRSLPAGVVAPEVVAVPLMVDLNGPAGVMGDGAAEGVLVPDRALLAACA